MLRRSGVSFAMFQMMFAVITPLILTGAVAGLAGITAASGYVSVEYAVVIGIIVGFASSLMVPIFKEKLKIDDALDIGAVHGISGIIGSLLVGVFANAAVNHLGINGWLYGNPGQLPQLLEPQGIAVLMGFGGTWVILKIIKALIPIMVSPEVEESDLILKSMQNVHILTKKNMASSRL